MKKILLVLFITLVVLTGCKQEETNQTNTNNSNEEQSMIDFLTNNTLDDNPTYKNNRFYVFTKDGKYAHYYGSRIVFTNADNILISGGTYTYVKGNLTLNQEYVYNQKYNAESENFSIEKIDEHKVSIYNDFKIVTRERTKENIVFVAGGGLRLEKKNDNVPKELVDQIKEYLSNNYEGFDFNKLKGLEEYDK